MVLEFFLSSLSSAMKQFHNQCVYVNVNIQVSCKTAGNGGDCIL